MKASMANATTRIFSRRKRFLRAGGTMDVWFLAAYGGGREVFLGGMAKCMVWETAWKRVWVWYGQGGLRTARQVGGGVALSRPNEGWMAWAKS